jgi:hypothetical protein
VDSAGQVDAQRRIAVRSEFRGLIIDAAWTTGRMLDETAIGWRGHGTQGVAPARC